MSFGAVANEDSWTLKQLMGQLSEVRYARLSFIETKQAMFLTSDLVIEGNMEYRAPGYLEKVTVSPVNEKVVVDGDSMTVEKMTITGKHAGTLQKQYYSIQSHPALQAAVGGIRAVLAGNYETLDQNYLVEINGKREDWTLKLVPKSAEISAYVEKILLSGKEASILTYVTIQPDGDESVMHLTYQEIHKGL